MKRVARIARNVLIALIALGVVIELGLRVYLGQPPLSIVDSDVEYMFRPNQKVHRFGHLVQINSYGMRSEDLRQTGSNGLYRVLVLGDSVVNGGNLTDQAALATEVLSHMRTSAGEPVEALNISAGSWGPGNMLAYLKKFGVFDADAAIVVLSSHDLEDDRTFEPLDPNTHPTAAPPLATIEFVDRYVQRYLPFHWSAAPKGGARIAGDAKASLPQLLDKLASLPRGACLLLHYEKGELKSDPPPMHIMAEIAQQRSIQVVGDRDFMDERSFRDNDNIHVNEKGQTGLLTAMRSCSVLSDVSSN